MAEQESTTDPEPISASATPSKDSNSVFEPQPSVREEIDRERDRLAKVFGICKTLQHALMYSDGDMDKNAMCYSDAADAAADIIDSVHAELERIMNRIKTAGALQESDEKDDDEKGED